MISQAQYEAAAAALEQFPPEARHTMLNPSGETCALGSLALAAGMEPKFGLILLRSDAEPVVREVYGLSYGEQDEITRRNDSAAWKTAEQRKRAVLKYLRRRIARPTLRARLATFIADLRARWAR